MLENTQFLHRVLQTVSLQPGDLCQSVLPSMQVLLESLARNVTSLSELAFKTFIGDPKTYNFESSWYRLVLSHPEVHIRCPDDMSDFLCLLLF